MILCPCITSIFYKAKAQEVPPTTGAFLPHYRGKRWASGENSPVVTMLKNALDNTIERNHCQKPPQFCMQRNKSQHTILLLSYIPGARL